ncbi:uncharacterized protein K02A2.6-like [Teleopsis dalmanni]|uniref:uncharacterized protein K02A2.6-like n=1 Tax=Teleopsis dalmanni TaxID=139649 RepID=UPI0018CF3297|nr:uncharacterized protein K02A2.6-like [Teleopsis dalmanni]
MQSVIISRKLVIGISPVCQAVKKQKPNKKSFKNNTHTVDNVRQVLFALIPQFKQEINRLIDAEILKPVQFSEWASPIVLVKKPDGSVRICADFKAAVSPQIDVEQYPLPLRENLFHTIRYGKLFTKIDLKDAYLQMEQDDETKKC